MHGFQDFYDECPFGVFRAYADGFAIYVNDACSELCGRDPSHLLGHGWFDAVDPIDRAEVRREWLAACSAGSNHDFRFRFLRPDGSRRFVRLKSRRLRTDGESTVIIAAIIDLTEQVVAERRLRRNNELLSAVLENIPCGITVYDSDGQLILDNQTGRALLNLPADPRDVTVTDFGTIALHPPQVAQADIDAGSPLSSGTDERATNTRHELQPDGRILEVKDVPMPTGGLVTTYTDVTDQRQYIDTLQQAKGAAEQAAAAKAAFLATMSHEIRTPMNGVIGMTNVLLGTRLTSDQREVVEVIRQSGESLLVVLNDILDYSKIESGQMEFEWLPLRLQDVVDNCVLLLSPRAQEKGVDLAVDVDSEIPPVILGDRTRLQQVLVNLISNAVKFTDHGEVRVALRTSSSAALKGSERTGDLCELEVCIEDTGIGISREKLGVIFEPFVQADSSTARRFGGSGLGLAIAKRLVEAMGGSISVQSEEGLGTRVCFTFLAEAAVPKCRATADRQLPLWRKRVLLVTGTRADVRVLHRQLERWGMAVELCPKPGDVRSRFAGDGRFDLVVAAAHMTNARWFQFVRSLRDCGISAPAVLLSRTSTAEALPDRTLGATILGRASTEATLYDGLADALRDSGGPAFGDVQGVPEFDDSLGQTAPLSILVAEDNEINRKVALRTLAGFGYRADVARNGAEAIEAVKHGHYDLVFMDIQMPEVDGIEATKIISNSTPAHRRPRIVAMSASVMREDLDAALAAGADGYIAKPFAPSQLREALEQASHKNATVQSPAAQPSLHLLDPGRLRSHVECDPTGRFLSELCHDFATTSRTLETRLRRSVRSQHVDEVRALVHEYAGMAAVIGAERLTRLLLEMQDIARTGSLKGLKLLIRRCKDLREETVAALEAAALAGGGNRESAQKEMAQEPARGAADRRRK